MIICGNGCVRKEIFVDLKEDFVCASITDSIFKFYNRFASVPNDKCFRECLSENNSIKSYLLRRIFKKKLLWSIDEQPKKILKI